VDFGTGYSSRVLSAAARRERQLMTPYARLPAELRAGLSQREYEQQQVRGDEQEADGEGGGLLPCIVFCFSKRRCEDIADNLSSLQLLTARETAEAMKVFGAAVARLSVLDAQLPQVRRVRDMLTRGVGVHHGGLLPLLKEVVELLFARSLVRVLVATETFAMGVNMPARCVVFNGFRKHDGQGFRDLLPGEYTQMAGRAGRRGKDKVGTVILAAWADLPAEAALQQLLTGGATKLASKFRLTYAMVLSLLRAGDMSVEDMIKARLCHL
jgi:antiviral helicase SKI2